MHFYSEFFLYKMPVSQTLMGIPGTELSEIKTVCEQEDVRSAGCFNAVEKG